MILYDLKHSSFLVRRELKNRKLSELARLNIKGEDDGIVARDNVGCNQ